MTLARSTGGAALAAAEELQRAARVLLPASARRPAACASCSRVLPRRCMLLAGLRGLEMLRYEGRLAGMAGWRKQRRRRRPQAAAAALSGDCSWRQRSTALGIAHGTQWLRRAHRSERRVERAAHLR